MEIKRLQIKREKMLSAKKIWDDEGKEKCVEVG